MRFAWKRRQRQGRRRRWRRRWRRRRRRRRYLRLWWRVQRMSLNQPANANVHVKAAYQLAENLIFFWLVAIKTCVDSGLFRPNVRSNSLSHSLSLVSLSSLTVRFLFMQILWFWYILCLQARSQIENEIYARSSSYLSKSFLLYISQRQYKLLDSPWFFFYIFQIVEFFGWTFPWLRDNTATLIYL